MNELVELKLLLVSDSSSSPRKTVQDLKESMKDSLKSDKTEKTDKIEKSEMKSLHSSSEKNSLHNSYELSTSIGNDSLELGNETINGNEIKTDHSDDTERKESDENKEEKQDQKCYVINPFFKSLDKRKSSMISFNMKKILQQRKERKVFQMDEKTQKAIEEQRFHRIISFQVRIMKRERIMSYDKLIQLTINEMKSIFIPSQELLNRCIDHLIESEYLQRDDNNSKMLIYIS